MSGFLVPQVQCDRDDCDSVVSDVDFDTVAQLRRHLLDQDWCKHHHPDGGMVDFCPRDGCCPVCSSDEALHFRGFDRTFPDRL